MKNIVTVPRYCKRHGAPSINTMYKIIKKYSVAPCAAAGIRKSYDERDLDKAIVRYQFKSKLDTKNKLVHIRLTQDEAVTMKRNASNMGMSISRYIRLKCAHFTVDAGDNGQRYYQATEDDRKAGKPQTKAGA